MSLCPNSSCIVCKSVPCSKRWVANEWRATWNKIGKQSTGNEKKG